MQARTLAGGVSVYREGAWNLQILAWQATIFELKYDKILKVSL